MKNTIKNDFTRKSFSLGCAYVFDGHSFDRIMLIFRRLEFEHDGDVCLLVFDNYETGLEVMIDEDFLNTYDIEVLF